MTYIGGDPLGVYLATYSGGSWSSSLVINTDYDDYDPVLVKDGTTWRMFFAPYIPADDHQWLMSLSSNDLVNWSTPLMVTAGKYGSAKWWDYWPEATTRDTNLILFYSSMRDGKVRGNSNIWMYSPVNWDLNRDHFEAIQPAIDFASPGNTIHVAKSTYPEAVTIGKSLVLRGDPGDGAPGAGANAPILDGSTLGNAIPAIKIDGAVSNVTVEGFEIRNYGTTANTNENGIVAWTPTTSQITVRDNYIHHVGYDGVLVGNGWGGPQGVHTHWDISNNIIENFGAYAIDLENAADSQVSNNVITGGNYYAIVVTALSTSSTNITSSNITVSDNQINGFSGAAAIDVFGWVDMGASGSATVENVTINHNTLNGSTKAILAWTYANGTGTPSVRNLTITNNQIAITNPSGVGYTLDLKDVQGSSILSGNAISLSGTIGGGGIFFHAIDIGGSRTGSWTIADNTLDGNGVGTASTGIRIRSSLPASTVINIYANDITEYANGIYADALSGVDVNVQLNNIAGNSNYGINNGAGAIINAEKNWWGSASGPGPVGPGSGDKVSSNVDFTPWLTAPVTEAAVDTMTNGETLNLPSGKVSATFTSGSGGSADVYLATYGSNPGSNVGTLIGAGNTFHDLYVANLTDPNATLTVQVAAGAAGQVLRYWDGSAWKVVHSNDWSIPKASGAPPKITVTFGANSRPRLVDLSGTPIVSSSPEAVAIQFSGSQVVQGQPITAKVVAKSTNLYGVELHLTFDASKLQVGSVTLGDDLLAESIAQNVYNNTAGTIDFAFSQQAPTPPQSGDDIEIASITFYGGSSSGAATVGYASTPSSIFSDPDGVALATYPGTLDAQPGSVTVIQSATVSGTVLLQGRSNHAGVNISTTTGGSFQTVTAANGAFALTGLTPNTVSYTIKASLPGYLDAVRAAATYNPGNNTLPTITLVGGDTTHDQQINILDLALIGGRFGSSDYQADLNADGKVNILDLTMAAANFGKSGPRTW